MKTQKLQINRANWIKEAWGFNVTFLTDYQIRITDGDKTLDLYRRKYHKIESGKRGSIKGNFEEIVENYFLRE